jgi:hypothetical protein
VKLLDDPHPLRRLAAARLLGRYGRQRDLPAVERTAGTAAPALRAALKEAATTIRSRGAIEEAKQEKVTEENLEKLASALGRVLWIEKDTVEEAWRWIALEKKFVSLADLEKGTLTVFEESVGMLCDGSPTASAAAFTADAVWVGTDRGLFAFERRTRTWSTYAVNREHIGAPVKKLGVEKGSVLVRIEAGGRERAFSFDPSTGSWEETE